MAAAAQIGFVKLVGAGSGRSYQVSVYASDVANAQANFSTDGKAATTTPTYWIAPERCVLVDFAIHTGMTDTTCVVVTANQARIPGSVMAYAAHLDTSNARPLLSIQLNQGTQLGLVQLA
jgi:hypothetical protein